MSRKDSEGINVGQRSPEGKTVGRRQDYSKEGSQDKTEDLSARGTRSQCGENSKET